MSLSFLPADIRAALLNLNYNHISEIRLRRGQPVLVEYNGEYKYLTPFGVTDGDRGLLTVADLTTIINTATDGCIYNYTEQMKSGFITVRHGIRIGLAGEYVTQNGEVRAVKNITSMNIRIPHNVLGCSNFLAENLFFDGLHSTLLYSKPGFGKTTMLRDLAIKLGARKKYNILVFDERNEISAIDGEGIGFDLGDRVDVVRCYSKRSAIASAIRAMKPDLIITDELYGEEDAQAVKYAADCGICVIASSHLSERTTMQAMPFEYFVELVGIGRRPVIYDKNFNTVCCGGTDDFNRGISIGK